MQGQDPQERVSQLLGEGCFLRLRGMPPLGGELPLMGGTGPGGAPAASAAPSAADGGCSS